jgi:predicted ATPase
VLQTAAVLGREVPFSLLQRLWQGEGDLAAHLQVLKQQELLYARGGGHDLEYCFKHALTQEVAYASLLLAQRQRLHAAAGQTLEGLYAERLEVVYDRLAYHYARTPDAAKAVIYLTHLAERTMRSHAHGEAVAACREALAQREAVSVTADAPYPRDRV